MLTSQTRSNTRFLGYLRYAHVLLKGVVFMFVILIIFTAYCFTVFRVQGESMQPTLKNHQLLPVFIAEYWFHPPEKSDVVIVEYAGDSSIRFVKRIVAVPGETVEFNGNPLLLANDEYFIEGDNRDHSTDSRSYGPIKRSQIIGHVLSVLPL